MRLLGTIVCERNNFSTNTTLSLSAATWIGPSNNDSAIVNKVKKDLFSETFWEYFFWASFMQAYTQQHEGCSPQKYAIKYKHLIANPAYKIQIIFKYGGLLEDLLPLGLKGMETDSRIPSSVDISLPSMAQCQTLLVLLLRISA